MKKFITFFILLYSINIYASNGSILNYNNIIVEKDEFIKLMNSGYTINEILDMNDCTMKELDYIRKENEETKYYKTIETNKLGIRSIKEEEITKKEYDNRCERTIIKSNGIVKTEYKTMTSTVVRIGDYIRFKNYVLWEKMPKIRSKDIITMGYDSSKVEPIAGASFTQFINVNQTPYVTNHAIIKSNKSSYGASFQLSKNKKTKIIVIELYMDCYKKIDEEITKINVVGDYAHAIS